MAHHPILSRRVRRALFAAHPGRIAFPSGALAPATIGLALGVITSVVLHVTGWGMKLLVALGGGA